MLALNVFLKRPRAQLLGRCCWDIFPQFQNTENARIITDAMRDRRAHTWQTRSTFHEQHWVRWQVEPLGHRGISLFVENIDEQVLKQALEQERRARASAELAHDRMRQLLAAIPTAILVTTGSDHTYMMTNGSAIAVVEDNGVGFDINASERERLGVVGLRERVEIAGGAFEIESQVNEGTTVIAHVPVGQ